MDKIKVRTLLEYRDVTYSKINSDIFNIFENQLIKAVKLFIQNDRRIVLEDISASSVEDHIRISAFSIPNLGDILDTDDGKLVVTQSNVDSLKVPMILTIPDRLLDNPDYKAIYRFISALSDLNNKMKPEEVVEIIKTTKLEDLNGYYNLEDHTKIVEVLTAPTSIDGFDTTNLSDYQKMQMKIFMDKSTIQ